MKFILSYLISFYLLISNLTLGFSQPGSLDASFGTGGKTTVTFAPPEDVGRKAAMQADGKIVQTGYSYNLGVALVRYNTNGTLDNTFDGDGKVTTLIRGYDDEGYDVAIQQNGKIVVAGVSYNNNGASGGASDFAVLRYNEDGSLDNTFNGNGKVTTAFGTGRDDAFSLAIQPDGRILVAGLSFNGSNNDFAVLRYNIDGTLDNSFNGSGKVITAIGSGNDIAFSVAVQPDGKILLAGFSHNGSNYDIALARYNNDGSPDISFDGDGKILIPVGGGDDLGFSLALQQNGKILIAGHSFATGNYDFALIRCNTDGSLDNSFDGDGKLTTAIGSSHDLGYSIVIQPDGKILVGGDSFNSSNSDFALVRYNINGSLDNTFDGDGKVTTNFSGTNDDLACLLLSTTGKVIATGTTRTSQSVFAIARYNGDVALPVTISSLVATVIGRSVLLVWEATEYNNAYFTIERSGNGNSFSEIARIPGKGNSSQPNTYHYDDVSFFNGENYYRLKQVDVDGRFTYSKIIKVELRTSQTMKIFPNPVQKVLSISGLNHSFKTTLSIINLHGKTIRECITTSSTYNFDLDKLLSGIYYVKIISNEAVSTIKFIKL